MNVGIGTVVGQFLSWEYLFRIFVIVSLQCRVKTLCWSSYSGYSDAGYHSMAPSRSPTATFSISSLENSSLGTYVYYSFPVNVHFVPTRLFPYSETVLSVWPLYSLLFQSLSWLLSLLFCCNANIVTIKMRLCTAFFSANFFFMLERAFLWYVRTVKSYYMHITVGTYTEICTYTIVSSGTYLRKHLEESGQADMPACLPVGILPYLSGSFRYARDVIPASSLKYQKNLCQLCSALLSMKYICFPLHFCTIFN